MEDVSHIFFLCRNPLSGVVVLVGCMIVALMLFSVGVILFYPKQKLTAPYFIYDELKSSLAIGRRMVVTL